MKPAVFVILAVVGLTAAAPHPDGGHGHGSTYQTQHKCHTTYKTVYETVYEEKCHTVYDTDYKTEYKKECETSYKKECYGYGYDKKCTNVPVEKCHDVPIQVPVQVPREICDKIPKQVPRQIPEKKCDSYGHGHSSGYHRRSASPHPAGGHGNSYQTQHKCHTTYKTVYETVYEEKCHTVYDTDYKTEYEKECSTYYDTIYESACETSYKKECYGYGYDKKCTNVPVEKCHQVPKQIPRESCQDIPIQVPVQVPREICDKIPKQVAKQIPEQKCDSYGHGHSTGYPHH